MKSLDAIRLELGANTMRLNQVMERGTAMLGEPMPVEAIDTTANEYIPVLNLDGIENNVEILRALERFSLPRKIEIFEKLSDVQEALYCLEKCTERQPRTTDTPDTNATLHELFKDRAQTIREGFSQMDDEIQAVIPSGSRFTTALLTAKNKPKSELRDLTDKNFPDGSPVEGMDKFEMAKQLSHGVAQLLTEATTLGTQILHAELDAEDHRGGYNAAITSAIFDGKDWANVAENISYLLDIADTPETDLEVGMAVTRPKKDGGPTGGGLTH